MAAARSRRRRLQQQPQHSMVKDHLVTVGQYRSALFKMRTVVYLLFKLYGI